MASSADVRRAQAGGARAGGADGDATDPVRVCFLIDRLGTAGTETQLLALIRDLDRSRVRPFLALLDGEDEASRALEPTDCPVLRLGLKRLVAPRAIGSALGFRRFLRRERIDVLQPYFTDSTYFGVLAGRLAGVRSIVRVRNNINHWMTPTHRRLGRLMNGLVTATLCNSEAARRAVLADERPDPGTVVVIENGVDLERFEHIPPVAAEREPTRPARVGMVANLRPVKGVDLLARAAAIVARSHPHAAFHVAGEGPQRPDLERLIDGLGLGGRFVLRGKVDDIAGFLAEQDIAVLSSRAEGMPNAVLEYMAAGRPIVAAAVGGVPALIEDGASGLLVPPEEPEPLARAIVRLLDEPRLGALLGRNARARARENHGRRAVTRRFESFFLRACIRRPTG